MSKNYSPVMAELIKIARQRLPAPAEKSAFIDQAGLGGGGAPPPGGGGDPAAMGGAPPPGAAGDPASAGAPPPPPPGGGGGGIDPMQLQQMIQTAVQGAMGGQGGAGGGAAGGIKPKIDVNVELMQIKNMLAKLCDQSGIQIPAQEMVATPDKLQQMAAGGGAGAGGDPAAAGGAPPPGAIPPIEPIQPAGKQAGYVDDGIAYGQADVAAAGMAGISNKARAIAALLSRR